MSSSSPYSPNQSEEMNTEASYTPHDSNNLGGSTILPAHSNTTTMTAAESSLSGNSNSNSNTAARRNSSAVNKHGQKPPFPRPLSPSHVGQQQQQKTIYVVQRNNNNNPSSSSTPGQNAGGVSPTTKSNAAASETSFVDTGADYAEILAAQQQQFATLTHGRNISTKQKRRLTNNAAQITLLNNPANLNTSLRGSAAFENYNNNNIHSLRASGYGSTAENNNNNNDENTLLLPPTKTTENEEEKRSSTLSFNLRRREAIPLKEKFVLNPWEKFRYYKRVPFKILVNVLILTTLLVFIYGYFADETGVMRNERFGLVQFFFPNAGDNTAASLTQTYSNLDDVVSFIQTASKVYYTIPDESSGIWMHFADVVNITEQSSKGHNRKRKMIPEYYIRPPKLTITLVKNVTVNGGRNDPDPETLFLDEQVLMPPMTSKDNSNNKNESSNNHQQHQHHEQEKKNVKNDDETQLRSAENDGIIDAWDYYDSSRSVATETITFDVNESTNFLGPFLPSTILDFQQQTNAYLKEHPEACMPHPSKTNNGDYLPCRGHSNETDFFDRILHMTLSMSLRGVRRFSSDNLASVVRWEMNFDITFQANRAVASIHARFKPYATHHFLTLPLISLSILLVLYSGMFVLYIRALWRYRRSNSQLQQIVEQLTQKQKIQFGEKLAGFSWRVFGLVCAVVGVIFCCLATACMAAKSSDETLIFWRNLSLASTFLFQCCLFLSHFQTMPMYYSGIKTVAYAIPLLISFIAGIFPMFIGFSILVYVNFGPFSPNEFGTISKAMQALFAASNGDSLYQFYTQMNQSENTIFRLWSFVSFTVFLLYFCGHAQNVIMGIVQASYLRVNETFELNYWDDSRSSGSSDDDGDSLSASSSDDDSTSSDTSSGTSSGTSSSSSSNSLDSVKRRRRNLRIRRARRKQKAREFRDLSDPIAVDKLAKKLKRMRMQKDDVMNQIDEFYYIYDGADMDEQG